FRITNPGGDAGTIQPIVSGQQKPWALWSDSTSLYWTDQVPGGGVYKTLPNGGPVTQLASGIASPGGIVTDSNYVYYTALGTCPADGGNCGGSVTRIPIDGGFAGGVVLAPNEPDPTNLAIDSTNLYWVNAAAGSTVISMPLGGGAETTIASNQNVPRRIAIDATTAYWTSNGLNAVLCAPLTGGTVTTLASSQVAAFGIAVDATAVYWATNTNPGTIMKVAKP
ncbi:MAG: hypothetical protein ACRENE_12790, partial [Polyangiaceae bacterium]